MSYRSIRILIHFRNSFVSLGPDQDCWFGPLALTHINPDLIRIRNSALYSSHLKFTVHNFWYKKCQLFQSLVLFLLAIKTGVGIGGNENFLFYFSKIFLEKRQICEQNVKQRDYFCEHILMTLYFWRFSRICLFFCKPFATIFVFPKVFAKILCKIGTNTRGSFRKSSFCKKKLFSRKCKCFVDFLRK